MPLKQSLLRKIEKASLSLDFLKVAEPRRLRARSGQRTHPTCEHACGPDMFGALGPPSVRGCPGHPAPVTHWPAVTCSVSVIIKRFLCSPVGVISPQDEVTAEQDVMENYHLHRPRALECSPASSPISLQEEREGKQKHKLRVKLSP